ncbi:MAG: hypothetical protein DRH24_06460 [Deltaproteobacteria bacterium]|nr:MAG: hypothetical protein DRH24_06460 [Deltaproteobacteria bacterium]
MSNNKDEIIAELIENTGWLAKQPIRVYKLIVNGDGSNGGLIELYDGHPSTGKKMIILRAPGWNTWQVDIPGGLKFPRGCYAKINAYATTPIVCFKYE